MNSSAFIACGMYVTGPQTQRAWQLLFDRFVALSGIPDVEPGLHFSADEALLRNPALLIGHTCGYPLMTRLADALAPFCVPVFDVPGTDGKHYRSAFIVPADCALESLGECRGTVVALNNPDSNSGMNVLRHALARLDAKPGFFAAVLPTGSHAASIEAVAAGRAQLAAIDCVTLRLVADLEPELVGAVRVIGHSTSTCGLPLVMPRADHSAARAAGWTEALNEALAELPADAANALHLEGFEAVGFDDYRDIVALEEFALAAGYPELN